MIKFTMRPNDDLGSYTGMAWRDTDTGEKGMVFRFPSEWYDEVLQIMLDNREKAHAGYEYYKSWLERMKQRKATML